MITVDYCRTMARYNAWQNHSLFTAAEGLSDDDRAAERGAFWGSISGTLSHLMWGDLMWLSRFDGGPGPVGAGRESPRAYPWPTLWTERRAVDARITAWAEALTPGALEGDLHWYSGSVQRDMAMPKVICLVQFFNHQTHHRGQVHAMLTAAGAKPDDTDLPFMPETLPPWP